MAGTGPGGTPLGMTTVNPASLERDAVSSLVREMIDLKASIANAGITADTQTGILGKAIGIVSMVAQTLVAAVDRLYSLSLSA